MSTSERSDTITILGHQLAERMGLQRPAQPLRDEQHEEIVHRLQLASQQMNHLQAERQQHAARDESGYGMHTTARNCIQTLIALAVAH